MADVAAALSHELARIIACPYPVSLAKLADILSRADALTCRACIRDRAPCAIAKLASIVSSALPHWQHTLAILHSLCHSPEFRDELLRQTPGLLDALLTKANSSQSDFEEHVDLCVTLLSRPLPEQVPLPASAQSFFLQLFERATHTPDVEMLRPIYYMLDGACRGLLSLVPPEASHTLDRRLTEILSSNGAFQNTMGLLCFGIVMLAERPWITSKELDAAASLDSAIPSVDTMREWKTAAGRKVFGSADLMLKTVNLTYLSVIWAVKGEMGVSDSEAAEGIRIAIRTLQLVDPQVREGWPNSSDLAKRMFPKLPSKIQRRGVNLAVQLEALCVYSLVAGKHNLSPEMVMQYQATLMEVTRFPDPDCLRESLSVSLPMFAPQMQETAICALLSAILRLGASPGSPQEMSNITILVEELCAIIPSSAHLGSCVVASLSSSELEESVQNFLRVNVEGREEDQEHSCHSFHALLLRRFVSATISMLLTSSIASPSGEPGLSQSVVIALISKQRQLSSNGTPCSHPPFSAPSRTVSLFQQECTPLSGQHLQDWRCRLNSELESQGHYQRDSIIRSVAQICHDLELRCDTVEEPLRREQERCEELSAQASELRQQVATLESKREDHLMCIDALQDERAELEREKNSLSTQLEQLRGDLNQAIRKSRRHSSCGSKGP